ncbi:hypothetical protein GO988_07590 [Hymenobacter sp. HMF4947]|uniref:Uncharacterized protein n=1 Tax=Hymenobacter ginkgonis TaxID=2682976 RepID=A0A7K1TCN8_9BACT|nr:hypothetical protein [Hymenobacter ginkgonis]MVN76184.1 hypothetical protein [Hymenobacter ginkgonis]
MTDIFLFYFFKRMLRKYTFLIFSLLTIEAQWALAQTKEVVKEQLSADMCTCLTKKTAVTKPETMAKSQIQQVFVACFGGVAGKNMNIIKQAYGQEALSNKVTMRTMGEEVGALLVQDCPASMGYFMAMADKEDATKSTAATTGQTVGKIGTLSKPGTGIALLEIQANKAEKSYFTWIRQFDKADELLRKLPQLQGQQARVSWEEVEILQPDTQQYQKVREITSIELL